MKEPFNEWEHIWSVLTQTTETFQELLRCGSSVEKGCRGRCRCSKAEILCTALCKCGGNCDRAKYAIKFNIEISNRFGSQSFLFTTVSSRHHL